MPKNHPFQTTPPRALQRLYSPQPPNPCFSTNYKTFAQMSDDVRALVDDWEGANYYERYAGAPFGLIITRDCVAYGVHYDQMFLRIDGGKPLEFSNFGGLHLFLRNTRLNDQIKRDKENG